MIPFQRNRAMSLQAGSPPVPGRGSRGLSWAPAAGRGSGELCLLSCDSLRSLGLCNREDRQPDLCVYGCHWPLPTHVLHFFSPASSGICAPFEFIFGRTWQCDQKTGGTGTVPLMGGSPALMRSWSQHVEVCITKPWLALFCHPTHPRASPHQAPQAGKVKP